MRRDTFGRWLVVVRMQRDCMQGIIVIDKPPGVSSAHVVGRIKWRLPRGVKVGHAGTLDPFATGVLLVLVGKATKSCEKLMDSTKQYEAVVRFGQTTPTEDPLVCAIPWIRKDGMPVMPPSVDDVRAAVAPMIGRVLQRPPAFSELKVGGQRAYDLAHKARPVNLAPRLVNIYNIEMLNYDWPLLGLRMDCGRGTYVRAIARDLGEALDVGGHLDALRRTRVGRFSIASAVTLEQVLATTVVQWLQPVDEAEPARSDF